MSKTSVMFCSRDDCSRPLSERRDARVGKGRWKATSVSRLAERDVYRAEMPARLSGT
jgi:hypothetical protein